MLQPPTNNAGSVRSDVENTARVHETPSGGGNESGKGGIGWWVKLENICTKKAQINSVG